MVVTVITDWNLPYDNWQEQKNYYKVHAVKVFKNRVLVFHDASVLQVPLDGRHSVIIC